MASLGISGSFNDLTLEPSDNDMKEPVKNKVISDFEICLFSYQWRCYKASNVPCIFSH